MDTNNRRESRRERLRRVVRATLGPPIRTVGGLNLLLFLLFAFAAAGTAIPLLLKKPLWVELEIAGAACCAILAVVLSIVPYKGASIDTSGVEVAPAPLSRYMPSGLGGIFKWFGDVVYVVHLVIGRTQR